MNCCPCRGGRTAHHSSTSCFKHGSSWELFELISFLHAFNFRQLLIKWKCAESCVSSEDKPTFQTKASMLLLGKFSTFSIFLTFNMPLKWANSRKTTRQRQQWICSRAAPLFSLHSHRSPSRADFSENDAGSDSFPCESSRGSRCFPDNAHYSYHYYDDPHPIHSHTHRRSHAELSVWLDLSIWMLSPLQI